MLDAVELRVRRLVRVGSARSGSGKLGRGEVRDSDPRTYRALYRAPVSERGLEPFRDRGEPGL
jgi:hypothetical protein